MITPGSSKHTLDAAFKPESIAVIGASNRGRLGGADMRFLIESGYKGTIYPVNPKEDTIQGCKAYRSVLEIPGPVDRAVIILSKKMVPAALKECAEKGVKVVQIYAAGFGEFGDEGKALEKELLSIIKGRDIRIIGPNCIGTHCPSSGITFTKGSSLIPGSIAFVSQSGGITFDMVTRGKTMGIHYSKAISVGNCIDLDHPDYLEYLVGDQDTKAIGFYIENVKNMSRFIELLKEAATKKPVVILKGGRTESGYRSVDWHTGNETGDYESWESLIKTTGAISVKTIDEMLSALVSFQYLQPFRNGDVAIVGNGGGASVLSADYCGEFGLQLAKLSAETCRRLIESGVSNPDWNLNPVDMPAGVLVEDEGKLFGKVIKAFSDDQSVKYILFHINLVPVMNYFDLDFVVKKLVEELSAVDRTKTNLSVVLRYNGEPEIEKIRYATSCALLEKGIPVYPLIEQAAFGISIVAGCSKN